MNKQKDWDVNVVLMLREKEGIPSYYSFSGVFTITNEASLLQAAARAEEILTNLEGVMFYDIWSIEEQVED